MSLGATTLTSLVCVLALCTYTTVLGIKSCEYDEDSCGCKTEKGLISLKRYENKELKAMDAAKNTAYHWNPCKDISIGSTTAACVQAAPPLSYDCGVHISTQSAVKDGVAVFHLEAAIESRQSEIKCVCKSGEYFKFVAEDPPGYYFLELESAACCPGGKVGGGGSKGLSGGSILLIVSLCLVIVYLSAGVAIQVGLRHAEGKERIPNVTFWMAVPGLIKDGIRFTFSLGKHPSYGEV